MSRLENRTLNHKRRKNKYLWLQTNPQTSVIIPSDQESRMIAMGRKQLWSLGGNGF